MATLESLVDGYKMKKTAHCIFDINGEEVSIELRYFGDQMQFHPQYAARAHTKEFTNTKISVKTKKVTAKESTSPLPFDITYTLEGDTDWVGRFLVVNWSGFVDKDGNPEVFTLEKFNDLILKHDKDAGARLLLQLFNFSLSPENFKDGDEVNEKEKMESDAKN